MGSMSFNEAHAILNVAREKVIDDFKKVANSSGVEGTRDFSTPCTLKWSLEGMSKSIEIETNLLGLLFIEFYSINNLGWSIGSAEVFEDIRKGECQIIGQDLDWIGEHFSVMAKKFGTMTPSDTSDNVHALTMEMMEYFVQALFFAIGEDVRKQVLAEIPSEFSEVAHEIAERTALPVIMNPASE